MSSWQYTQLTAISINNDFSLRFHSPVIESPEPSNLPSWRCTHCGIEVNDSHCAPSEFLIHKIHGNSKWLLEATKLGANLFLSNSKQNAQTTNLTVLNAQNHLCTLTEYALGHSLALQEPGNGSKKFSHMEIWQGEFSRFQVSFLESTVWFASRCKYVMNGIQKWRQV